MKLIKELWSVLRGKKECPFIMTKPAGDESYDMCRFLGERCLIEHGGECETWDLIQKEEK